MDSGRISIARIRADNDIEYRFHSAILADPVQAIRAAADRVGESTERPRADENCLEPKEVVEEVTREEVEESAVIICHCHAKSDREIRSAVRDGACTRQKVIRACSAGRSCGGCMPAIDDIIRSEQESAGLELAGAFGAEELTLA
jgi:bacterioferritin-associated ferredoxin